MENTHVRAFKRLKREKDVVEKPTVTVNCMMNKGEKDTEKSVHSDVLLSSEETEMVAKIILLGMEIVVIYGNILYVESCKKKTPNQ
jgi:hypothetical protein